VIRPARDSGFAWRLGLSTALCVAPLVIHRDLDPPEKG
jgi:hypothetical protein